MLPACATIVAGPSQFVGVVTEPPGATCILGRAGRQVGVVPVTPDSLRVGRSRKPLSVTCGKDGYETASIQQPPRFNGITFGNIVLGGPVGVVVDAADGANFAYPAEIHMKLAPDPARRPTPLASDPLGATGAGFGQPGVALGPVSYRLNRARASY